MRYIVTIAALAAAGILSVPAAAQTKPSLATRAARLHAGPLIEFPVVRDVRRGATVGVHGCLDDWSWCDVTYRTDRGWIPADALDIGQHGESGAVAANSDIEVTAFTFEPYWRSHYRGRRFYSQRQFWRNRYEADYRPEWGDREQHADELRLRYQSSSDPQPMDDDTEAAAPSVPYAFPDHSRERGKGKDPAVNAAGPAIGSTPQEPKPGSGEPARNPQP